MTHRQRVKKQRLHNRPSWRLNLMSPNERRRRRQASELSRALANGDMKSYANLVKVHNAENQEPAVA